MSGIDYSLGYFLGTFLECAMYGIFISFFIAACYVQWEKSSEGRGSNRLMALATGFFGLTVTAHLTIALHRTVGTILHNPPGATILLSPGPPFPTDGIVSFMIFHFQTMVTDILVVYRMYHIYDRNPWVCVVPSTTIAALFVVGCGLANQLRDPIFNRNANSAWCIASFCLTMFNCFFLTSAISFRLWCVHCETTRTCTRMEDSVILRAMKVLIESAALWTTFTLINFFASLAKSNIVYTFAAMSSPVLGICFCLIMVRLGRVFPVVQEEIWDTSRTHGSDRVAVSPPKVETRQDVYVRGSEVFRMETLESQTQEYADYPHDSSTVFRSSLSGPGRLYVQIHRGNSDRIPVAT